MIGTHRNRTPSFGRSRPETPREVADGVVRFGDGHVNWYAVVDRGALTIVDAGLPAHWDLLSRWLSSAGYRWEQIEAVVLTHGHPDHLGVAERLRQHAGARVHVHDADRALTAGQGPRRPPPRIVRNLWRPRYLAVFAAWARAGLLRVPPVAFVETVADGETLDLPGRLRVVHTPGHTAGSVSLHAPDRAALFTGDALCTLDPFSGLSGMGVPPEGLNADTSQALASLDTLEGLPDGVLLPGHGAPWRGSMAEAVTQARRTGPNWAAQPGRRC